jgi:hypothetical protein
VSVTLGNEITLTATATLAGAPVDDPGAQLSVLRPDADVDAFTGATLAHSSTGAYSYSYLPPAVGSYTWQWSFSPGIQGALQGTFEVASLFSDAVSDLCDLRVLIPAARRAIDGPMASAPDSPATTLDDQALLALVADSTAELILQTHGHDAFGYHLLVSARDPHYMAPVAWATDKPRHPAADAAILSQAALDHYHFAIRLLKVSESMKNEAVAWEYNLSATVIASWMQYLIANRDAAIAALQVIHAPMDQYISLVAERDLMSAVWLESYVAEVGAPVPYVGGGGSGPLTYDFRFQSFG